MPAYINGGSEGEMDDTDEETLAQVTRVRLVQFQKNTDEPMVSERITQTNFPSDCNASLLP